MCSEPKKIVFSFWLLKLVFGYSALSTKHKLLKNPNSDATHIQPTPTAPHSISPKLSNTMGNSLSDMPNLGKPISLKTKKAVFCHLFGSGFGIVFLISFVFVECGYGMCFVVGGNPIIQVCGTSW